MEASVEQKSSIFFLIASNKMSTGEKLKHTIRRWMMYDIFKFVVVYFLSGLSASSNISPLLIALCFDVKLFQWIIDLNIIEYAWNFVDLLVYELDGADFFCTILCTHRMYNHHWNVFVESSFIWKIKTIILLRLWGVHVFIYYIN